MTLFRDGEHLVFFDGEQDLKAKVHYYLTQPLERARIAAAGRSRVLAEHTYKQRLLCLLEGGGA